MSEVQKILASRTGLQEWMQCAFERLDKVRPDFKAGAVHDLRVALRRCRTMSEALRQVTPDPAWRKIKKESRDLFHALGELRDEQMQREWLKRLSPRKDALRDEFARHIRREEAPLRKAVRRAIKDFDARQWRKLAQRTQEKAQLFPLESVVFQRLALQQLQKSIAAYDRAKRTRGVAEWHRTRIELKKFRYLVENFLPQRHEAWSAGLKSVQDLLGDIHDLDVLHSAARRFFRETHAAADPLMARIAEVRKERVSAVVAKLSGLHSPFREWLAGFQHRKPLVAASFPSAERRTA